MAQRGRRSTALFGDEKLEAFFRSMRRSEKYQLVMQAYEQATEPLIAESKGELVRKLKRRSRTLNLYNSLGFVPGKKNGNSNYVEAKVGARRYGKYKGYHGHLIDAGTATRQTRKGFNRGRMPATNFFTNAVTNTEQKVTTELREQMIANLQKLIESQIP